jgi:hypothetical protein
MTRPYNDLRYLLKEVGILRNLKLLEGESLEKNHFLLDQTMPQAYFLGEHVYSKLIHLDSEQQSLTTFRPFFHSLFDVLYMFVDNNTNTHDTNLVPKIEYNDPLFVLRLSDPWIDLTPYEAGIQVPKKPDMNYTTRFINLAIQRIEIIQIRRNETEFEPELYKLIHLAAFKVGTGIPVEEVNY